MCNSQKVIFGLEGADKKYRAAKFFVFYGEEPSVEEVKRIAYKMVDENPNIKEVYLMDNKPQLKWDFRRSFKGDSIESCYIFKDLISRSGLPIPL